MDYVTEKFDRNPSPNSDIGAGVVIAALESARGTAQLAQQAWACAGFDRASCGITGQDIGMFARDPKAAISKGLLDGGKAAFEPVKEDVAAGRPGRALGRVIEIPLEVIIGGKGLRMLSKAFPDSERSVLMNSSAVPLQQLVERAKDGSLSTADVDHVAQQLKVERPGESTYNLLYVLSRTRATRHESTVASFLDYREDPMVARLALQTLCSFWGQTSRYLSEVRRFVAGVDWDYCGDVRQVALSAAGEFLRDNRECELFQAVYNACTEAVVGGVEERTALEALARALGMPLSDSLSAKYLEERRPELLAQGGSWLESECGGE